MIRAFARAAREIAPRAALAAALALAGCSATLAFEGDDAASGADALDDGAAGCATAGCPIASLACDVASGTCVECLSQSDCSKYAGLPICDPSTHTCVDCLSVLDCGPNKTCVLGAKQCVPGCSASLPCAEGTCDKTTQACVACTSDAECKDDGQNLVCDLATKQCVGCVSDKTCPVGHPRCDPASQQCVQCMHASDCANGEVCEPMRRLCVKP
jgi:hypothetical protein